MIKFCRSCGNELVLTPGNSCSHCGANPVKPAAFCRFCGNTTNPMDVVCSTCGAVVRPIPAGVKALNEVNPRLVKLGKTLNLSIVITLVSLYIIVALPRSVTKSIQSTTSDLVMASTGYTALPLNSISCYPNLVPPEEWAGKARPIRVFTINSTQQLTIYSNYLDTTGNILAGGGHSEDVTDKAVYRSNDDRIASVSSSGLVEGVSPGIAVITVLYTSAPGSANRTSSAEGKIPITVGCQVTVKVVPVPVIEQTALTQQ